MKKFFALILIVVSVFTIAIGECHADQNVTQEKAEETTMGSVGIKNIVLNFDKRLFSLDLENKLGKELENIKVFVSFYDNDGVLVGVSEEGNYSLDAETEITTTISAGEKIKDSEHIKVMVWDENDRPFSETAVLKSFKYNPDVKVFPISEIDLNENKICINEKEYEANPFYEGNGNHMICIDDFLEMVPADVYYNEEYIKIEINGKYVKAYYGEETMETDDGNYRLWDSFTVIDEKVYIPLEETLLGLDIQEENQGDRIIVNRLFDDVLNNDKYYEAIYSMNMQGYGYFNGYEDGTYKTEGNVMRSSFAKVLCNLEGINCENLQTVYAFEDMVNSHWCYRYASYVTAAQIMETENRCFYPDRNITLKEVLLSLFRLMGEEVSKDLIIDTAEEKGLLYNADATEDEVTRGNLTQIIYNFMEEYYKIR